MNLCQMDSRIIQTHRYFNSKWFQCCLHRCGSSTTLKTTKKPITKPTCWALGAKMSTLTPPKGTFHSFFFNKTLYTSYWGIYEWIWILALAIWPIWKNGHFSTRSPYLQRYHQVQTNMAGDKIVGLNVQWDFHSKQVRIVMKSHVNDLLLSLNWPMPKKP